MQSIHQNIIHKLDSLKNIKVLLAKLKHETKYRYDYQIDLESIEQEYNQSIIDAICSDNEEMFIDAIHNCNILSKLNFATMKYVDIFQKYKKRLYLDKAFKDNQQIEQLCHKLQNNIDFAKKVNITLDTNVKYKTCNVCASQMLIDYDKSEIRCEYCGIVETLIGKLQRIEYSNVDNVQTAKEDMTRHLKRWLHCIQGTTKIENPNYANDIEKIKQYIHQSKIDPKSLNVKIIRKILKTLNLTEYNSFSTNIIIDCDGNKPPILTDDEFEKICFYILKIFSIKKIIDKPCNKKPYYPYYIYKVLENNIIDSEKQQLMKYIHMQDKKTLKKCDLEFELICKKLHEIGLTEIVYRPTTLM